MRDFEFRSKFFPACLNFHFRQCFLARLSRRPPSIFGSRMIVPKTFPDPRRIRVFPRSCLSVLAVPSCRNGNPHETLSLGTG